jgi:membrane carboxypeptidase/penicillin-binding protein
LGINGLENFIATASAMGLSTLKTPRDYGLSLALGAGEVTMNDMATAFGTVANEGVKVPPISILKVTTYDGKTLYEAKPDERAQQVDKLDFLATTGPSNQRAIPSLTIDSDPAHIYRVLDKEPAYMIADIMADNGARSAAFGTNSELFIRGRQVAAKTGTTNDIRDNWTVGFTPQYLTIVWVGNNNNQAMNQNLVSGVTGAAPIWNDIMSYLVKDPANAKWPEKPADVVSAPVCKRSGSLPNPAAPADQQCEVVNELFWRGLEPQTAENVINGTWVAGQTGLPPREGDPTDQLKFENHVLLTDPFTRDYCLDCVRAMVDAIDDKTGQPMKKPVEEKYFVTAERLFQVAQGWTWWEKPEDITQ